MRGLWLSGLRLNEALNLYWDCDDRLRVDLSGRRPMLWIPASLNKNGKQQLLPITPDFAAFLAETPEKQRRGRVFGGVTASRTDASRIIAAIGEAALVKIREGSGETQFATAHDLRRSFGERWAARGMPHVLKELMRHETIDTTMKFYVGRNAERTADAVWAAHEDFKRAMVESS
jgi:integrase